MTAWRRAAGGRTIMSRYFDGPVRPREKKLEVHKAPVQVLERETQEAGETQPSELATQNTAGSEVATTSAADGSPLHAPESLHKVLIGVFR